MRHLAGIIEDNQEFTYRQAAIESQNALAEAQTLLRYLRRAVEQEATNPGSVDWPGVHAQISADRDAL